MGNRHFDEVFTPGRLWALFFIQLNEGYQINVILPFVVFLCRDLGINEDSIGVYAGLLTATFALTQFISSYFWLILYNIYVYVAILSNCVYVYLCF